MGVIRTSCFSSLFRFWCFCLYRTSLYSPYGFQFIKLRHIISKLWNELQNQRAQKNFLNNVLLYGFLLGIMVLGQGSVTHISPIIHITPIGGKSWPLNSQTLPLREIMTSFPTTSNFLTDSFKFSKQNVYYMTRPLDCKNQINYQLTY